MRTVITLCILLIPTVVWSEVVPCLEKVDADTQLTREQRRSVFLRRVGRKVEKWYVSQKNCLQQTRAQAERSARIRIAYKGLQKKWLNVNLELKNTKRILHEWETVRMPSWKTRIDLLTANLASAKEDSIMWKGSAEKYRQMYLSQTPKWYAHPAFVAVVSALTTTAVLYAGSQIGRAMSTP